MRDNQDLIPGPVEGFKVVSDDLVCRGYQFEIGKRHSLPNDDPLELCKNGFHFFKHPSGPWTYHDKGRLFRVRAYGVLPLPVEPGADHKLVCEEIELCEEVTVSGDRNTGNGNTGDWNTGDWNTGDWNTGHKNTGDGNTGDGNTGDWNTGDWNTGDWNTGDWNTGHKNTGNGNTGDHHSGSLNYGAAPIYLFNKKTNIRRDDIPWRLINKLSQLHMNDEEIDPTPFLSIPNSSAQAIKELHGEHIKARKGLGPARKDTL